MTYDRCPQCSNTKVGEFLWTCKECETVFCTACEGGGKLAIKCPRCGFEAGTMISPGRIIGSPGSGSGSAAG